MHPALIALEQTFGKSLLTPIHDPFLEQHQISLWIKRDDLLHSIISGNKWRKLKYNLDAALTQGKDTVISMGGAYSNHLHALAYAGKKLGLKTIGIIRGERPIRLSPTLYDIESWGMELRFVSRADFQQYRNYKHPNELPNIQPNQYWLPEGGANKLALKGLAELVTEIDIPYDTLCVACGTGTTLAGLINAVPERIAVLGIAALKNAEYLHTEIKPFLTTNNSFWAMCHNYHFGGFAKYSLNLERFMQEFEEQTLVPLESVYTGKLLFGIYDLIAKGYFKPNQRIIALHTGGLQGKRGLT